MRTRFQTILVIILILAFGGFIRPRAQAQTTKTSSTPTKPGSSKTKSPQGKSGNKSAGKSGTKNGSKVIDKNAPKPGALPAGQDSALRAQATGLVKFFESTLNFLADKKNTVQDKQVIINDSYLKFFWDSEVQIEDDLDTHQVPMYKDVQSYLADVDFFFKQVKFTYNMQDIGVMTNELGNTFFKVTCNRNITGINLNGDNVNTNQVRYLEINYDEKNQQLKIVSRTHTQVRLEGGHQLSGKIQRLDVAGRAGKPLVAQTADPDAEIGAVARHHGDNGAAFDIRTGVRHRLAGGHNRVEDAQGVI